MATGRRGVSLGVIAALVAVVVVVGAVILWRFFGDALSNRTDAAAARCVDGELAVAVVADPSIADQVQTLADTYNETAAPVGDRCVKVGVKPADSDQVVNGFIGKWPAELGERPALWIPASSVSEARLEAAAGRADRQRQPITGHLAGPARHPTAAQRCAGPTELGNPAGAADQPDGTGRAESARLGPAAARAAAQRRQRRVLSGRRGGGGGVGTGGRNRPAPERAPSTR